MPKNRKLIKKDGMSKKINVPSKNRIGTRKSGISATLMSNETLKQVLADESKARYHSIAETILRKRGAFA